MACQVLKTHTKKTEGGEKARSRGWAFIKGQNAKNDHRGIQKLETAVDESTIP